MKANPVLLIFSGGLDTSFCAVYLRKQGFDPIYTVTVDVGQPAEELKTAKERARKLRCIHKTVDQKNFFIEELVFPALFAHAQYGGYYLATALARPAIAKAAVEIAKKEKITFIAHGCTGKGNDQFRLEYTIRTLLPKAKILAPIREGNFTRQEELQALKPYGLDFPRKPYSIDENLWGRAIEGEDLENLNQAVPEALFAWTQVKTRKPVTFSLEFKKGKPVRLNNTNLPPAKLIQELNTLAGSYGLGRAELLEDRILGIKSREVYEFPAASVLYLAHAKLEELVLTKQERQWREILSVPFSEILYQGLYYHPFYEALKAFFVKLQERLTGTISFSLEPFHITVLSRQSPFSLYDKNLISFDTKTFPQKEVSFLLKIFQRDGRVAYGKKEKKGK